MNGVVKINKCSVNKVMRVVHDTKNAYSVCLFTANYTKQADQIPASESAPYGSCRTETQA